MALGDQIEFFGAAGIENIRKGKGAVERCTIDMAAVAAVDLAPDAPQQSITASLPTSTDLFNYRVPVIDAGRAS